MSQNKSPRDRMSSFLAATTEKKFEMSKAEHESIVKSINAAQTGWTAAVYDQAFLQQKMEQFRRKAMTKLAAGRAASSYGAAAATRAQTGVFGGLAATTSDPTPEGLPRTHSWSNCNGTDWLEPVLDQADCGSCYAVSSVHMLSARFRILKNNPKLEGLSINFPLYCSDLNQGCNGGYPSLVSMWSGHVGLLPKSCGGKYFTSSTATCKSLMQRSDMQNLDKCLHKAEHSKTLAQVVKWNYVGGYYGGCSVEAMMRDLYRNGPVAVALEPAMDFMYYRSGVYKSTSVKTNVPWVKVDHAVLLIGWGEEPAAPADASSGGGDEQAQVVPYWTIQNSWGKEWGEGGNIRVIRGENESGVEFQAVSAELGDGRAEKILSYVKGIMEEEV